MAQRRPNQQARAADDESELNTKADTPTLGSGFGTIGVVVALAGACPTIITDATTSVTTIPAGTAAH